MPLYEYQCDACGARFERIRKFSDPPLTVCPTCGAEQVRKLISSPAFQFKGSGFYITDYARKSDDSSASAKAEAESKADAKSDAKNARPDTAADTKTGATKDTGAGGDKPGSSSPDKPAEKSTADKPAPAPSPATPGKDK